MKTHERPATLADLDRHLMRLQRMRDLYAMTTGNGGTWLELVQASRTQPYTLEELVRVGPRRLTLLQRYVLRVRIWWFNRRRSYQHPTSQ